MFNLQIDEASHRSLVRNRPAEINLDLDNLAIPDRHYFGIPKGLSGGTLAFIGYEHALPSATKLMKVKPVMVLLFFQHLSKYTSCLMRLSRGLVK